MLVGVKQQANRRKNDELKKQQALAAQTVVASELSGKQQADRKRKSNIMGSILTKTKSSSLNTLTQFGAASGLPDREFI